MVSAYAWLAEEFMNEVFYVFSVPYIGTPYRVCVSTPYMGFTHPIQGAIDYLTPNMGCRYTPYRGG